LLLKICCLAWSFERVASIDALMDEEELEKAKNSPCLRRQQSDDTSMLLLRTPTDT
jgi:hypothetical protein